MPTRRKARRARGFVRSPAENNRVRAALDEERNKPVRENHADRHADRRDGDGGQGGEIQRVVHAFQVLLRVVVRDEGEDALRHSTDDAVREHIDFFRDPDPRLIVDTVPRHEVIEYRVGDILEEGHQARGQTGQQHPCDNALSEHGARGRETQDGLFPMPPQHDEEIDGREEIREESRDCRAEDLLSPRENHKHKERVKRHIEHPAEDDPHPRVERSALRTDEMPEQGVERGHRPADDDRPKQIGRGVGVY